ncbi:MAG: hypothetical protein KAT05_09155 [Spirochaetes bacterium]|nr:hypothetical protein [Spirochaetota bacterium]
MDFKFNTSSMIKGVLYALILASGMFVGIFVESIGGNFYIVWTIVSIINIIATIFVFKLLQGDLKDEAKESKFHLIE